VHRFITARERPFHLLELGEMPLGLAPVEGKLLVSSFR
jgi:hypothetical protein